MKNFYRDGGLVLTVIALTIVTLTLSVVLYIGDTQAFWVFAPFIVLTCGFAIGKLILVTRKTFQYLTIIKNEIAVAESTSLYHSPTAIAIIDKNERIVWFNAVFAREFKQDAHYGTPLNNVTTASSELLLSGGDARVKYGNKYYKVNATTPQEGIAGEVFVVYLEDITKEIFLELEQKLSKPVVVIVMIDSYEEVFLNDNSSESVAASIMVRVDKLLEDYVKTTTGILRKIGRDRYVIVLELRHIQELIEGKVKLLDKARKIAVTDRMNVTLSIGIGKTGANMNESERFARQALEMALGRGGDQAAVKTKSGFEFYGGFSKGIERHTKVKARIIANSLLDLANHADIIYIMGHKFSDLDSVGSAVGLACGLRNLGMPAYVVINKETSLAYKLIESLEKHMENNYSTSNEGDEESGSPQESSEDMTPLFIEPEKAHEAWTDDSLLVIVDTHNKKLLEDEHLYEGAKKVVVIDHHRKMVGFIENALIFHHEVAASSAAEMVTELLQYFGEAGIINGVQAEALLAGIILDTKNFTLKTGVRTFEAAAFLRKLGADTVNIKSLFAGSIDNYKLKSALVANASVYRNCAIACTEATDISETGGDIRIIAPQAADELLEIEGVLASFLVYRTSATDVNLSARSIGKVNVQVVMEELGGGGHHNMAGVQMKDVSIGLAERKLREAIDKYFDV
ncbi:MAG: DHH family phosphoesterase [Oscillospiraceae bacterium]|nr:DHH family phosphoesterase [Oscillospiraceae bacterium]